MKARYLNFLLLIMPLALAAIDLKPPHIPREPKVIYGIDDRTQLVSANAHPNIQQGYEASVSIMHRYHLKDLKDGTYDIVADTWKKKLNMCDDEPFINEPIAANCSGVLIAPNLVLTASHCIIGRPKDFCKHYRFVFGYRADQLTIPENNIYRCAEILENEYIRAKGIDWALVSLNREVENVEPININLAAQVESSDTMTLIGYPAGLPIKVTNNGTVREILPNYIKSNFDSFTGNSGSPVYNDRTGELIGLLIRGEEDYQYDKLNACLRPKQCRENECAGEDIVKITSMEKLTPYFNK